MTKNFYFTFGSGWPERSNYVKVQAETLIEARQKFFAVRGSRFAFSYTEEEFLPQMAKYGLTEIPLQTEEEFDIARAEIKTLRLCHGDVVIVKVKTTLSMEEAERIKKIIAQELDCTNNIVVLDANCDIEILKKEEGLWVSKKAQS